MKKEKTLSRRLAVLLGVALATAASGAETAPEPQNPSAEEIRFERGKQNELSHRAKLEKAESVFSEERFGEALELADSVLSDVEKESASVSSEVFVSLRKKALKLDYDIRLGWHRTLMKDARRAAGEALYPAAIELANQAKTILSGAPGNFFADEKVEVDRFLDYCRKAKENADVDDSLKLKNIDPQAVADKKKIKQLLHEADTFVKNRHLEEALGRVEQVFLLDPSNSEATELAGRIYNKLYAFGAARRLADMEGAYAQAEWQWVEPVFPVSADRSSSQEQGHVKVGDNDRTLARMDGIVFPQVEFEDADVSAVLDWLSRRSATFSPDHRIFAISREFPAGSSWRVSLSLKNIPMSAVLRYICQQTGLKYRLESDGVVIGPAVDEMISRRFTVPSTLSNYVVNGGDAGAAEEEGGSSSGGVTQKGASASGTASENRGPSEDDWKNYFRERGVGFPDGSKINYSSQAKMLIVRNTPENLRQLDTLLRQLETVANKPLIMVELKSIEVSENDMQELGFDWALGTNNGGVVDGLGKNIQSVDPVTGDITFKQGKDFGWLLNQGINTVEKGILSAIRGNQVESTLVEKLNVFPAIFGSQTPFGSDMPLNINLTINALDQNTRAERLSAPKMVTSNDVEAEISMGKSYYFPDSWDTLEVEVDTGDNTSTTTITPPVPNFPEDPMLIGVNFKVKPQVLADNRTIRMVLEPSLSSYEGDDRYNMALWYDEYIDGKISKSHQPGEMFSIYKPVIDRREMKIECDLDNGETVVLGGLVKSNTTSRVDKVPLLGDLPLIGRLFQSHSDNAERTNLLFFVTARLLSYDGVPIERNNTPGLPDFNR